MSGYKFGFVAVTMLLSMSTAAMAGVVVEEDADGQTGLRVYLMTVTPAAEPQPALKHRLTLRELEYVDGNAATDYMRGYGESTLRGAWKGVHREYGDEVDRWYSEEVPISELPLEAVRRAAAFFDDIVEQFVRPASVKRNCDFGLDVHRMRGPKIYNTLLPHLQELRSYARMLALRTRLAIAEGRYEEAIENMRMNYRLAHNMEETPFLVSSLIGLAVESVAGSAVIDLIGAEDSPNLYWALCELPQPLVGLRRSIRTEMSLLPRVIRALEHAETATHSREEWSRLLIEALQDFEQAAFAWDSSTLITQQGALRGIAETGFILVAYPAAKERLIASGMGREEVETMPVGQVMLVDASREYRRIADEQEKWWYAPYADARLREYQMESVLQDDSSVNAAQTLGRLLLPAVDAARNAQIRNAWKKNALLVLEALRMHAAERGSFPKNLQQIQVVPVPLNPITNEPYEYRLEGKTAVLELPYSDGMPGQAMRYEMTLAE